MEGEGDRSQGLFPFKLFLIKLLDFLKWDPDVKAFGLACYYFACIRREAYLCHRVKWDIKNPKGMEEIIQSPLLIRHLKVDIPMYGLLHSLMPTNKKNCIESIEIVQYLDDENDSSQKRFERCNRDFISLIEMSWLIKPYYGRELTLPNVKKCRVHHLFNVPSVTVKCDFMESLHIVRYSRMVSIHTFNLHVPCLKDVYVDVGLRDVMRFIDILPDTVVTLGMLVDAFCINGNVIRLTRLPPRIESFTLEYCSDGGGKHVAICFPHAPTLAHLSVCCKDKGYNQGNYTYLELPLYPALTYMHLEANSISFDREKNGMFNFPRLRHLALFAEQIVKRENTPCFLNNLPACLTYLKLCAFYKCLPPPTEEYTMVKTFTIDKDYWFRLPLTLHTIIIQSVTVNLLFEDADFSLQHEVILSYLWNVKGRIANIHCQNTFKLEMPDTPKRMQKQLEVADVNGLCPSITLNNLWLKSKPKNFAFSGENKYEDE